MSETNFSKVYFADRNAKAKYSMLDKLERLWKKLELDKVIKPGMRVLIKTHFGASGNTNYIRPAYIRRVVDLVKKNGAYPAVAESTGLGYGRWGPYGGRSLATDYIEMAASNGFTVGTVGAPIIMLDGYWGTDSFEVKINGNYLKSVHVAMALKGFDVIIMMTHAKGHGTTGFGGTLKNLGIGCVAKQSKALMHTEGDISVNSKKCKPSECGAPCLSVCPHDCISISDVSKINTDCCILCLHCKSVCTHEALNAITVSWSTPEDATKKMVENALGVIDSIGRDKFYYFNLALDISEMCDCASFGPAPIVPDIGIFASRDPVAIDKAVLDMINAFPPIPKSNVKGIKDGVDKLEYVYDRIFPKEEFRHINHIVQIEYAEELGLGSQKYQIEQID